MPTVSTCASMGYFTASNPNCDCQYGYTSAGVSGTDGACYRCGSSAECVGPNGATKCATCAGYTYDGNGYVPPPGGGGGGGNPGTPPLGDGHEGAPDPDKAETATNKDVTRTN